MHISQTKLECPVLAVLIPLQVLLNFRITYSPPLGDIKGLLASTTGMTITQIFRKLVCSTPKIKLLSERGTNRHCFPKQGLPNVEIN
jgi:hypothetical protein